MHHEVTVPSFTGRIDLSPPSGTDDEAASNMRSSPEVMKYLRFMPVSISPNEIATMRESRDLEENAIDFHMRLANTVSYLGGCRLFKIDTTNRSCSAGILVVPGHYRGGVATETFYALLKLAFEEKGMNWVQFETGVDNVAMRGWFEKFGVTHEFVQSECWRDAQGPNVEVFTDVSGYSVLEREWKEVEANLQKWLQKYVID